MSVNYQRKYAEIHLMYEELRAVVKPPIITSPPFFDVLEQIDLFVLRLLSSPYAYMRVSYPTNKRFIDYEGEYNFDESNQFLETLLSFDYCLLHQISLGRSYYKFKFSPYSEVFLDALQVFVEQYGAFDAAVKPLEMFQKLDSSLKKPYFNDWHDRIFNLFIQQIRVMCSKNSPWQHENNKRLAKSNKKYRGLAEYLDELLHEHQQLIAMSFKLEMLFLSGGHRLFEHASNDVKKRHTEALMSSFEKLKNNGRNHQLLSICKGYVAFLIPSHVEPDQIRVIFFFDALDIHDIEAHGQLLKQYWHINITSQNGQMTEVRMGKPVPLERWYFSLSKKSQKKKALLLDYIAQFYAKVDLYFSPFTTATGNLFFRGEVSPEFSEALKQKRRSRAKKSSSPQSLIVSSATFEDINPRMGQKKPVDKQQWLVTTLSEEKKNLYRYVPRNKEGFLEAEDKMIASGSEEVRLLTMHHRKDRGSLWSDDNLDEP